MRLTRKHRIRLLLTGISFAFSLALAACVGSVGGQLGQLQHVASRCPSGKQIAGFAAWDVSATGRSAELAKQRLVAIRSLATLTAVCSGHLRVDAFSSSSAASTALFDGDLAPVGATQNARLRRVPDLVDNVTKTVERNLSKADKELPSDGTDVLAQLGLAREFAQQVGTGHVLKVEILSDGISTTGVILNTPELNQATAADLGNRVSVPSLSGASITFAGVGKVASGPPAPTAYVDALKTFYVTACKRTTAKCTVVTDFEGN